MRVVQEEECAKPRQKRDDELLRDDPALRKTFWNAQLRR